MAAPKKTDTKELILESTSKLIEERNVESISLQDIATEANISKGTLYYYYTTKQLILMDIVERYLQELAMDFAAWIYNKDKDTSLYRVVYYVLTFGGDVKRAKIHLYSINYAMNESNVEARELFMKKYRNWEEELTKNLQLRMSPDKNANHLAKMLLTTINGILMQYALFGTKVDYKETAKILVSHFEN